MPCECVQREKQLPPINKQKDNHLLDNPHIFLDQIMRQAEESEIIRYTMKIRAGESLNFNEGSEVMVLPKESLSDGMLDWADIVLCGTNKTRTALNNQMRIQRGFNPNVPVEEGEKIICLQNYWENVAELTETPLTNGTIGYASEIFSQTFRPPYFMKIKDNKIPIITANFTSESGDSFNLMDMDEHEFTNGTPYLTPQQNYQLFKNIKYRKIIPKSFTYGYAITYWKAQGSQWEKVLIYEEAFPYEKDVHQKALYTALTRASKKVVLLR